MGTMVWLVEGDQSRGDHLGGGRVQAMMMVVDLEKRKTDEERKCRAI